MGVRPRRVGVVLVAGALLATPPVVAAQDAEPEPPPAGEAPDAFGEP